MNDGKKLFFLGIFTAFNHVYDVQHTGTRPVAMYGRGAGYAKASLPIELFTLERMRRVGICFADLGYEFGRWRGVEGDVYVFLPMY